MYVIPTVSFFSTIVAILGIIAYFIFVLIISVIVGIISLIAKHRENKAKQAEIHSGTYVQHREERQPRHS